MAYPTIAKTIGVSAYQIRQWHDTGRLPDPNTTPIHVLLQACRVLLVADRLDAAAQTAARALKNPKFTSQAAGTRAAALTNLETHPVNGITASLHGADPLPPSDPDSLYQYIEALRSCGRLLPLPPHLHTAATAADAHQTLCDMAASDTAHHRYHVADLITALDSYANGIRADDPNHPLPVQPQTLLPWYNPTETLSITDDSGINYAPAPTHTSSGDRIPIRRTPLRTTPPLTLTGKHTCTAYEALSHLRSRLHAPLSHTVFARRDHSVPTDPVAAADCYPLPKSHSARRTWYTRTDTLPGTSVIPMRLRHPARTVRTVVSVTAPTSPGQQPQPVLWYRLDYTTKHYLVHLTLLPAQSDQSDIHLPPVRVYGHGTTARAALYRAILNLGITSPPPLVTSQRAHIALTLIWLARWLTGSAQTVLTGDDPDAHPAPSSSPDN